MHTHRVPTPTTSSMTIRLLTTPLPPLASDTPHAPSYLQEVQCNYTTSKRFNQVTVHWCQGTAQAGNDTAHPLPCSSLTDNTLMTLGHTTAAYSEPTEAGLFEFPLGYVKG